ncbi:MAG: chemotaxis protein CheW [Nannocystaceae bacterium]|nr:chemotaxis protein CheW [Nannocystaceae bacterium]
MQDSYDGAASAEYETEDYDEGEGDAAEDAERADTHLIFSLDDDDYAIPVAHIKEVVRLPEYRKVPDVPDFIRGVMNLRGRVVPLMDSSTRLGLGAPTYTNRTVVIVLESDGALTGLVADGVSGVCVFPPDTIEPYSYSREGGVRAVRGLGRSDETSALILDIDHLLGVDDDQDQPRSQTAPETQNKVPNGDTQEIRS